VGRPLRIIIIGAGMSGICMAIKLLDAGFGDVTLLEKGPEYGGTWEQNTYPGLTCDVPAPFYSYTFAPNPDWSQRFAPGDEIQRYLQGVAERHDLRDRTRFGTEVLRCEMESDGWVVHTSDGGVDRADVVIAATGVLHRPRVPDIPGLDSFGGSSFHSARWDHGVRLAGARVGVIGSGSTGVQIVTALGGTAGHVTHFQRTPQWMFPFANARYRGLRLAQRRWPALSRLLYRYHQAWIDRLFAGLLHPGLERRFIQAACRWNLRRVRDPGLRRRLTPDYVAGCKRLVVSWGYYRDVQRDDVEVVDSPIERIVPEGVVTADGRRHAVDVLVFATGFDAHAYLRPMEVVGRDGVTLAQAWSAGPFAHRSLAIPGFPNLFLLMGPGSPIGNTSLFPIAEAQAEAILRLVRRIAVDGVGAIAPAPAAAENFRQLIRDNMPGTIWVTGCDSWYLGADGTPVLWPFPPQRFYEMLAELPEGEFTSEAATAVPGAGA
jgi:cation diffusion facilitator CzcD-associated flavoprotein CzcO